MKGWPTGSVLFRLLAISLVAFVTWYALAQPRLSPLPPPLPHASASGQPRANLRIWTFDPRGPKRLGTAAATEVQPWRMIDMRLRVAALASNGRDAVELPADAMEVELSLANQLRVPDGVQVTGWVRQLLAPCPFDLSGVDPTRLATWNGRGPVVALPIDVHPVMLLWREDRLREAGIDLAAEKSWGQVFHRLHQYQAVAGGQGRNWPTTAIALPKYASDILTLLLAQQHVRLTDDAGNAHLEDGRIAPTLIAYAQLFTGEQPLAVDCGSDIADLVRRLRSGEALVAVVPDWKLKPLKELAPDLAGKLRVGPLPVWDEGDAPTATWGGSAVVVPKSQDSADIWVGLQSLYLSESAAVWQYKNAGILVSQRDHWPAVIASAGPDAFFAGQNVAALLVQLAEQAPAGDSGRELGLAQRELTGTLYELQHLKRLPAVLWLQDRLADSQQRIQRQRATVGPGAGAGAAAAAGGTK